MESEFVIVIVLTVVFLGGILVFRALALSDSPGPADGIPALGIVRSIKLAGGNDNYKPHWKIDFDVHYDGGKVGYACIERFASDIDPNEFEVGTEIPLNVHPKDPNRVYIARGEKLVEFRQMQNQQRLDNGLISTNDVELATNGKPAQAVIKSLHPTGVIQNNEVQFEVAVMAAIEHESLENPYGDPPAQELHRTVFLPEKAAAQLHVGKIVQIRYDAENWQNFVICL